MFLLQWGTIFSASALAICSSRQSTTRRLILCLLGIGYSLALLDKQLNLLAITPLLLLLLAAVLVRSSDNRSWVALGHALFIVLAVVLGFHLAPGFHNPRVWGPESITPNALAFTMYLNLDKPLIGFWVLLTCAWATNDAPPRKAIAVSTICGLFSATLCLELACSLGLVGLDPKLPAQGWLWGINNLLLVCFAEEAFFRAYLQGGLTRLLPDFRHKDTLVIAATALLFGLVHFAGGWQWMLVVSLAGACFGVAYKVGGLRAAILSHFGLNVVHFLFFTYPMLNPHLH